MIERDGLVHIDGSHGEGGGQILRTSLTLSLVTGRALQIENIRAGRGKPGLMRQHLTAVRAAATIGGAEVTGDEIGSQSLTFRPATVRPGSHTFSIGTAGSTTLVLQTVLPALLLANEPSQLVLEGGTHNPWAPPYDFLAKAYFPLINRLGPRVSADIQRHGFYPAGGGRFTVDITPARQFARLELLERGEILHRRARAIVAKLPTAIGRSEVTAVAEKLNWPEETLHVDSSVTSTGPGNVLCVEIESEHVCEVFTGFGRLGASSEKVAEEVLAEVCEYLAAGVPVGTHLADQLLLPLGIAAWQTGRGGAFRTLALSRHSTTHVELLRAFLEIPISVEREKNSSIVLVGN